MGVEYFSLRFGVASPFLLKRTRVFLCLWSKPWFWKPEGLLFDSVEERLILACEWKKQLFVCCWLWEGEMEDRSPLLCTLVAHCSFGAATNNKSKNKADMQRVQECVYTCMYIYIYIYIYIHKSHMCCAHTHRVKRKNSICRQVPWAVCRLVSMKRLFSPKKAGS